MDFQNRERSWGPVETQAQIHFGGGGERTARAKGRQVTSASSNRASQQPGMDVAPLGAKSDSGIYWVTPVALLNLFLAWTPCQQGKEQILPKLPPALHSKSSVQQGNKAAMGSLLAVPGISSRKSQTMKRNPRA